MLPKKSNFKILTNNRMIILNILIGLFVIGITVTIQAFATGIWIRRLLAQMEDIEFSNFRLHTARLLISTSVFLIFIHLVQASIWAVLYMLAPGIVELNNFEEAMYFSLVTFTTLGYGDITISSVNRILSGLEAINGIILIGWSTAFMFSIYQQMIRRLHQLRKKY